MRIYLAVFFLCLATTMRAQVFPVDTLQKTGPLDNRINLVFVGDGYQSGELSTYQDDVNDFITGIFKQAPFKQYKNYFNTFSIQVPSVASGASHPQNTSDSGCSGVPVFNVDNYFGSTYDTDGIHRLLAPTDYVALTSVLADNLPQYDAGFIIVNAPYYGGSGGTFSTASTNVNAIEVAVHEIGHSFAFLADEYWAGDVFAGERANMTKETNKDKIKWKNWLNVNGIGIYPHAENPLWQRPHNNCKMRFLNVPFCSVCGEAFIERIHDLVNPIDAFSPQTTSLTLDATDLTFAATVLQPTNKTVKITWKLNGVEIAKNKGSVTVPVGDFTLPTNRVRAEVIDTTTLSRSDTHVTKHVRVVEWTVKTDAVTGIEVDPAEYHYKFSMYPNPVSDHLAVTYSLSRRAQVTMTITDAMGRRLRTIVNGAQDAGQYDFNFTPAFLHMDTPGVYMLILDIDRTRMHEKILRN